jgi:hypothetical protein
MLGKAKNSEYAIFGVKMRLLRAAGMDIGTVERELVERMARFVKAELKRADMTYEQLADKLREMGHDETKISVANKINRGTFPATFFVATMKALGREQVNLADL